MEQSRIMAYTPRKDQPTPMEQAQEAAPRTDTEKLAELKETKAHLDRLEARTIPGAPSLTPKARVLDASAYERAHPEKYVRYTSTTVPEKMAGRIEEGFSRVDSSEAEKHGVRAEVGPMVLTEQPRELHEERIERQKARNKELLESHNREVEATAEAVVRQLRDKHGIDVPIDRLLVRE